MGSQSLEPLCRSRDPRLRTTAIHAGLRRIHIAAKLWYMVVEFMLGSVPAREDDSLCLRAQPPSDSVGLLSPTSSGKKQNF